MIHRIRISPSGPIQEIDATTPAEVAAAIAVAVGSLRIPRIFAQNGPQSDVVLDLTAPTYGIVTSNGPGNPEYGSWYLPIGGIWDLESHVYVDTEAAAPVATELSMWFEYSLDDAGTWHRIEGYGMGGVLPTLSEQTITATIPTDDAGPQLFNCLKKGWDARALVNDPGYTMGIAVRAMAQVVSFAASPARARFAWLRAIESWQPVEIPPDPGPK